MTEERSSDAPRTRTTRASIFIRAPIEKVWAQITKRDGLQAQFFNARMDTPGLEVGAPIRMRSGDGVYTSVVGEVLEFDPPHRFSHTFRFTTLDDPWCRVTYELKEAEGGTEFTLISEDIPVDTKTEGYMAQGNTFITEVLKGVCEDGRPPLKYRLMLTVMGWTAFMTPERCRSEHWPFDDAQQESA